MTQEVVRASPDNYREEETKYENFNACDFTNRDYRAHYLE